MSRPELVALAALATVAEDLGVSIVLIGALAREIVFDLSSAGHALRATRDVDAGVHVQDWDAYEQLMTAMVHHGHFVRVAEHKLRHHDGTEVDLLPFGGVADEGGNITWLESGRVMSVGGFPAAAEHSRTEDLDGVRVRVVNLPGLVALKLFAFGDRRDAKDLQDLLLILGGASDELRHRTYEELDPDVLVQLPYEQVGPLLLGRDIAAMLPGREREALMETLDTTILTPPDYSRLAVADRFGNLERWIGWFEALRAGIA